MSYFKNEEEANAHERKLNVTLFICGVAAMGLLWWAGTTGLSKSEEVECLKWQREAKEYPRYNESTETGYYLLPWQAQQCAAHGIGIDAHVIQHHN